jgi:hypothetical protein
MAPVKCVALQAVPLPDGALLPPGRTADVDLGHPEIRLHLDTEALVVLDPPEIPDTVREILEWVGEDDRRAELALIAERDRTRPRSTLVEQLKQLLATDPAEEEVSS